MRSAFRHRRDAQTSMRRAAWDKTSFLCSQAGDELVITQEVGRIDVITVSGAEDEFGRDINPLHR